MFTKKIYIYFCTARIQGLYRVQVEAIIEDSGLNPTPKLIGIRIQYFNLIRMPGKSVKRFFSEAP